MTRKGKGNVGRAEVTVTFIGASGAELASCVVFEDMAHEYRKLWLRAKAAAMNRTLLLPPDTEVPAWNRGDKMTAGECLLVTGNAAVWLPDVAVMLND